MPTSATHHAQLRARSYKNLQKAQLTAAKKSSYNSTEVRAKLTWEFRAQMHSQPYPWQLDAAEAMLLGLDAVMIAGTGSGKMIPFMLPLMLDPKKKIIIISPLKVLQEDQAEWFAKAGITAAAIHGDTWDAQLSKDLDEGRFQGLLTSPEMCLKHREFQAKLTTTAFQEVCAVVVDEVHCIAQWGGNFRTAYSELGKLHSFFPSHIPFYATSATLTPQALQEVHAQLAIDAADSFFLNLSNDHPNISYSVHNMKAAHDVDALKPFLVRSDTPVKPEDLQKTIVFVNKVATTQIIMRALREWLPPSLSHYVGYLNAHRSVHAKRRVMRKFREGQLLILIATEAASMGADIPDIEQVIQFGVPSSLSVWVQRASRAGRTVSINAQAILLVEKSMFEQKKGRRNKPLDNSVGDAGLSEEDGGGQEEGDILGETDGEGDGGNRQEVLNETASSTLEGDGLEKEWKKKTVLDDYFDNPPERHAPTHVCCDKCDAALHIPDRPSMPEQQIGGYPSSPDTMPSKSPNAHGKRKRARTMPAARHGEHLALACTSLLTWRYKAKYKYLGNTSYTVSGCMSDQVVNKLASARCLETAVEIQQHTGWIWSLDYGEEVLQALRNVDEHVQKLKDDAAEKRKEERRQKKDEEQWKQEAQRQQEAETLRPSGSRTRNPQPLMGCMTLNFSPHSGSATSSALTLSSSSSTMSLGVNFSSPFGVQLTDFQVGPASSSSPAPPLEKISRPHKRQEAPLPTTSHDGDENQAPPPTPLNQTQPKPRP